MIHLPWQKRYSPIGVDLGSRCVKLVQLSADRSHLIESARWDLPSCDDAKEKNQANHDAALVDALRQARQGRRFHGNEAVLCLGSHDLIVQNLRVPKSEGPELERLVHKEAAGRLPFAIAESEIRYVEAADVRQGDMTLREVLLIACHRPRLERLLDITEKAGMQPVSIDIQPAALIRSYAGQFRRDEDRRQRSVLVHVGYGSTAVIIAQGQDALFIKYVELGGKQMDDAVARHLNMPQSEAAALRRHNGDRRADQQDPEVTRSVRTAARAVVEQLCQEVSMCIRYHSVTFRGQPLARLVLGGGEANEWLCSQLQERLDLPIHLGEPLRTFQGQLPANRHSMWDVAAGLALREVSLPN